MNLAFYCLLFTAVGVGFIFVHLVAGKLIRPNKPGAEKKTIYECGEPTIGSAWIQFDLRFYVVALLFVIFDVEVAFFFPWAEVFGRANDVAALTKPTAAAAYPGYCRTVLALAPNYTRRPAMRTAYETLANANDTAQIAWLDAARRVDLYWEAMRDALRRDDKLTEAAALPPLIHATDYHDFAASQLGLPSAQGMQADVRAAFELTAQKDPNQFEPALAARKMVDSLDEGSNEPANVIANAWSLAWMAFFDILVFFGVLLVGFAYLWRRGDLAWVRSTAAERTPPSPPTEPAPLPAPEPAREHAISAH